MDEPRQHNTEHSFYMDDIELNATLCLLMTDFPLQMN